ncbi:MAG: hypothetical protein EPN47_10220 [Acidobacteria bacterium]|nr:MAG: hypothetical protein EPN47_10220 [Acidobacteriota bacterium]
MQIGDAFLLQHLWIVISDPAEHRGTFLIVNITTDKLRAGGDCELRRGDHEWIIKTSYVSFGDAREVGPEDEVRLIELMKSGKITKHFPARPAILQKIIQAAKESKSLPIGFRKYFPPPQASHD